MPTEPSVGLSAARTRTAVLAAIFPALCLAALDQTIVATAMPRIAADLVGDDLYTWVMTSYVLTYTLTVPVYGKLSDVYGRKPVLLFGIALFLAGSALSGQARSMAELVAYRGLEGLGGGAIFPVALAVIGDLFAPRERGRYEGLFAAVFAVSSVLGPLLGGLITDTTSWRWVFYVNVPIGLVALLAIAVTLPRTRGHGARVRDLDYLGVATCTAAVVPLLIGLTEKGRTDQTGALSGWLTPQVGGLIGVGVLMLLLFLVVESRAREPILPLDLFRNRTYALVMAAMFLVGFAMYATELYLPRYYQVVEQVSATRSGLEIWPLIVGFTGGSIAAGQLISRSGRYKAVLAGSLALLVAGAFLMTHLERGVDGRMLWSWMLLVGFGIGPALAGYAIIVQAAVPADRLGVAAGTLTFFRRMGGALGLAVAGTVFNAAFASQVPRTLPARGVPAPVADHVAGAGNLNELTSAVGLAGAVAAELPAPLRPLVPDIVLGLHDAFATAVSSVFWPALLAAVLALVCVLAIKELPLGRR